MNSPDRSRIAALVDAHQSGLLQAWVDLQLSAVTRRKDLQTDVELREQSASFMQLLREALKAAGEGEPTGPAWQPVRQFLEEISSSRARQGFSPSETATFVFSLKQPLFERLRQALEKSPGELPDALWQTSVLIDQLGLFTTEAHQKAREAVIHRQQAEMMELSTPVVQLWQGVLALPVIGTLDSRRTQTVMETLLQRIVDTGAEVAIIDITGVPTVDTITAQHLIKTVTATRLMGAECVISGVRPQIAQTIVQLGIDIGDVTTRSSLAGALDFALKRLGLAVKKAGG